MPYTEDLEIIWKKVILKLGETMPRETVQNMFTDIIVESFDGEVGVMSMHSEFRHSLLLKRHMPKIRDLASEILGKQITLKLRYSGPVNFT